LAAGIRQLIPCQIQYIKDTGKPGSYAWEAAPQEAFEPPVHY